jgi:hypothetical protein
MTSDIQRILDEPRTRGQATLAAHVPIDYAAANAAHRRHKTALTRAINSGDPKQVQRTVVKTVREWNANGWPWADDWSRWQRALDDSLPWNDQILLEDIR